MTPTARTAPERSRYQRRVQWACEYARRAAITEGAGIGHHRIQVPGYQVSVVVTPAVYYPARGHHVSLLDHLTGDAVQYTDLQPQVSEVLADARTLLARYLADNCGSPAP